MSAADRTTGAPSPYTPDSDRSDQDGWLSMRGEEGLAQDLVVIFPGGQTLVADDATPAELRRALHVLGAQFAQLRAACGFRATVTIDVEEAV
jgi:hypothetical protein